MSQGSLKEQTDHMNMSREHPMLTVKIRKDCSQASR